MRYRLSLLILLLISILPGCFLLPKEEKLLEPPKVEAPEVVYSEVAVTRGDIVNELIVVAYFEPTEEHTAYFTFRGGRLKDTYFYPSDEVKKGDVLAELEMGDLPSRIEEAEIDLEIARLNKEKKEITGADKYDLRISELNLQKSEIRLRDLRNTKENMILYAPIDGIITYKANKYPGDIVDIYYPIYRVADSTKLSIVYTGDRIYDFKKGMQVTIKSERVEFQGIVVQTPDSVPSVSSDQDKKRVIIKPDGFSTEGIARGTGAQLRVVLFKKEDVLKLPTGVVKTYNNRYYVNILKNGLRIESPVEIGVKTALETEILRGLEEGEKVLY